MSPRTNRSVCASRRGRRQAPELGASARARASAPSDRRRRSRRPPARAAPRRGRSRTRARAPAAAAREATRCQNGTSRAAERLRVLPVVKRRVARPSPASLHVSSPASVRSRSWQPHGIRRDSQSRYRRTMRLERWRDEFPILSRTVYMISNSLGAMPRRTAREPRRVRRHVGDARRARVGRALVGDADRGRQQGRPDHRRTRTARSACTRTSRRRTWWRCRRCARPDARKRIVCSAMDFPSMVLSLPRAGGRRLRAAHRPGRGRSVGSHRADDRRDRRHGPRSSRSRTCCSERRTSWTPPRSSRARAQAGAAVILDTYQSAGIVPVDVTALGVDFAVGGCLKWLCGGPGNAFLYTRPDLLKTARPAFTGWLSHQHPFAFDIDDRRSPRRRDAHDERDAVDSGLLRRARPGSTSSPRSASSASASNRSG